MTKELVCVYPTGNTLYAHLFDRTGQVYNGSTFEAPASANWATYDIALAEATTNTQIYRGDMPAVAAGIYSFIVRLQAGGSPAVADIAVATATIDWDGTVEITMSLLPTDSITADSLAQSAIDAIHQAGAGAITFTYTLTSSVDSAAIPDAQVWVTSDEAGTTVIASGTTDSNGQVTFYLDAGTLYFWRQKPGWNFANPYQETVS